MKTLTLSCGALLEADVEDWGGVLLRVEPFQPGAVRGCTFTGTALELASVKILIDRADLEDVALFFDNLIDERDKEG